MKINNGILENFYTNAIQSYKRCIQRNENSFLSDEIGTSMHNIELEKDSVKFKYLATNSEFFLIEVRLNLLSDKLDLGYYVSVLDEDYKEVDNYLVFN